MPFFIFLVLPKLIHQFCPFNSGDTNKKIISFVKHFMKNNISLKEKELRQKVKSNKCNKLWSAQKIDCHATKLKGVFAKNERGYRLMAKNYSFWSLLILLLSVASVRIKLLKTTKTEERSVHTNSESCNILS